MIRGVSVPVAGPVLLWRLLGANMQSTADQAFTKMFPGTAYLVSDIVAVRRSGGTTVACAGGVCDAAAKGGNAIVAAGQSWLNLSAANKIVKATLAAIAGTDAFVAATAFLSLTTGSTAAATADLYIFGYNADAGAF